MEHDQDTTRQQPPPYATKQLLRRPHDGPLGGVCAGVARYFDVDPTVVRIAAVILAFMGPGIPAYLIAWAFVPAGDGRSLISSASPTAARHDRGTQVFGITLLVIAGSVLWGDWWSPARHWLIPLGCIALGCWLLFRKDDESGEVVLPPPPPPGAGPTAPASHPWSAPSGAIGVPDAPADPAGAPVADDGAAPTTEAEASAPGGTDATAAADPTDVADPTLASSSPYGTDPTLAGSGPYGTEPPGPPTLIGSGDLGAFPPDPVVVPRRRRILGPIVFGALLVWAGVAVLVGIQLQTALAVALCIVGVGFVLGAFLGGAWGLVVPAVFLGGALVLSSIVDIPLRGGIGDRTWRVADEDDLRSPYELALGEGTLDLRDLEVPAGRQVEIEAKIGVGHLVVLLPEGTTVAVRADVGLGDADVLGLRDEGPGIDIQRDVQGDPNRGEIDLDVELGIGELEIRQVTSDGATPASTTTTSTPVLG